MATKYFKRLKQGDFHTFFENLDKEVTLNAGAWSIAGGDVAAMSSAFNTYKPLYNAVKNKRTSTAEDVEEHTKGRTVAMNFIQQFANEHLVPNDAIKTSVLNALGFNRQWSRNRQRPRVEGSPFSKMDAQPGSRIAFTNRTAEDASRASVPPMADGVEVRYAIGTVPKTWKDCPYTEFSTKAKFTIELDPEHAGKKIYSFTRWKNIRHPAKSGPFSDMLTTMIRS